MAEASGTDEEDVLMVQAARGSRVAMDRLYDCLSGPVFNYLIRMCGDYSLAEDVMQTTFMAAWQGRATFKSNGAVRPWIFSIARNTLSRTYLRNNQSVNAMLVEPATAAGPANEMDASELAALLDAALARLPGETREAVVLSRFSGMTLSEIATTLGCSEGALRVRLSRGLARLKKEVL